MGFGDTSKSYIWENDKLLKMAVNVTRTFDILERWLQEFPRQDALGGKNNDAWYTYSTEEYHRKSHHFALGLLSLGYKKGDKIATVTANRPEWNFADMGMAMTGIVHIPIYPTIGEDEYKYILEHSEAKMIMVGDQKLYTKLRPVINSIPGLSTVFSFEEVDGIKSYSEIILSNKDKSSSSTYPLPFKSPLIIIFNL